MLTFAIDRNGNKFESVLQIYIPKISQNPNTVFVWFVTRNEYQRLGITGEVLVFENRLFEKLQLHRMTPI